MNDSTAFVTFAVVSAVGKKLCMFLFCSPEGFDFSHICLCVLWFLIALTHTLSSVCVSVSERVFVCEKEGLFIIKISYFCDIFPVCSIKMFKCVGGSQ